MVHYGSPRIINILKSYSSIYQGLIIIPQEKHSNHQKVKMVKIKVLTGDDQLLTFDLTHDLIFLGMISRIQENYFDLIS